jgi:2OG-Fe(II) oxygenase superfamily
MNRMTPRFSWTTFDLTNQLPAHWQEDISVAAADADVHDFPRTPLLSREAKEVAYLRRGRVHADQVRQNVPWLYRLYRGYFLELAREICAERVLPAADDRYGVVLNIQRGKAMRFECHVDSNPLTGLLFCTDHRAGAGGELVIGNDVNATGKAGIDRDCSIIRPQAGQLIFFDGSHHPHYARPLSSGSDMRVVAVMNFYTKSRPESTRPPELNRHLFGQDTGPLAKIHRPEPVSSYIRRLRRKVPAGVS